MRGLDGITNLRDISLSNLGDGEGQGSLAAVHGVTKSWTRLSNWTTKSQEGWFLLEALRGDYFHLFFFFFFNHLEATSILWLPLFSKYHFNPCFCHHITFFSNFSFISIKESSDYVGPTCIIQDNLPILRSLTLSHMLNPFCQVRLSFTISGD